MSRVTSPISVRISEALALTGLSRNQFYDLLAEGEVKTALIGRTRLVEVESLKAAVAKRFAAGPVSDELSAEMSRRRLARIARSADRAPE